MTVNDWVECLWHNAITRHAYMSVWLAACVQWYSESVTETHQIQSQGHPFVTFPQPRVLNNQSRIIRVNNELRGPANVTSCYPPTWICLRQNKHAPISRPTWQCEPSIPHMCVAHSMKITCYNNCTLLDWQMWHSATHHLGPAWGGTSAPSSWSWRPT